MGCISKFSAISLLFLLVISIYLFSWLAKLKFGSYLSDLKNKFNIVKYEDNKIKIVPLYEKIKINETFLSYFI